MKMRNTNFNSSPCSFDGDVAGYLYGEIEAADKFRVADHLAACTTCADEFASISEARFSVNQWRMQEFSTLPTPRIFVEHQTHALNKWTGSWLPSWRGFNFRWPALAAFAVLVAAGSVAVFYIEPSVQQRNSIAASKLPGTIPRQNPSDLNANDSSQDTKAKPLQNENIRNSGNSPKQINVVTSSKGKGASKTARPVRASASGLGPKPETTRPLSDISVATGWQTTPRLNEFDENEDETLRLADILAEIDVS